MNPIFRFTIATALLLAIAAPCPAQLSSLFGPKIKEISTDELHRLLEQHDQRLQKAPKKQTPDASFVLVDVRSDKETAVSIIPGAITKAQFEKQVQQHRHKTIIPYCTVGGRSSAYAKQLIKQGYKVKNYKGSILDWVKHQHPVVTLEGKSTKRVHTYSDRYRIPSVYEQVVN